MSSQTVLFVLLTIQILQLVQSDILFDRAYIKFLRHGKRETFREIEHIDKKIVPSDKHMIIVKTRSMEILYSEAVRNLENIRDVFMVNCGIQEIEPKAFYNLPNLTTLKLQDNQIREITKSVFNGLSVKNLFLHRNEIRKIASDAFDDMPNLFRIKLNFNRLKVWDSGWFKNTPQLTELFFRRNKIHLLPANAFANIKTSHTANGQTVYDTKIFLSKNKLGRINPESFYNLRQISQLYLDRNSIEEVPDGAFRDLTDIDVIYLARNKISVVKEKAFPKIRQIGILDLSSNLLECLPYELVTVANVTNLEKNNATCQCAQQLKLKLKQDKRNAEISYDEENCVK